MKKVIDLLQRRKQSIEIQLDNCPLDEDAYIISIVANQLHELDQINQAIEILTNFNKEKP